VRNFAVIVAFAAPPFRFDRVCREKHETEENEGVRDDDEEAEGLGPGEQDDQQRSRQIHGLVQTVLYAIDNPSFTVQWFSRSTTV
jgi:hypothetical protein